MLTHLSSASAGMLLGIPVPAGSLPRCILLLTHCLASEQPHVKKKNHVSEATFLFPEMWNFSLDAVQISLVPVYLPLSNINACYEAVQRNDSSIMFPILDLIWKNFTFWVLTFSYMLLLFSISQIILASVFAWFSLSENKVCGWIFKIHMIIVWLIFSRWQSL